MTAFNDDDQVVGLEDDEELWEAPEDRDNILSLLGVPPDGSESCIIACALVEPASPYGVPYSLPDQMGAFSIKQFAETWGAGRYTFRARKPNGTWGSQKTLVLHGPAKWEERFAKVQKRRMGLADGGVESEEGVVGPSHRELAMERELAELRAELRAGQSRRSGLGELVELVPLLKLFMSRNDDPMKYLELGVKIADQRGGDKDEGPLGRLADAAAPMLAAMGQQPAGYMMQPAPGQSAVPAQPVAGADAQPPGAAAIPPDLLKAAQAIFDAGRPPLLLGDMIATVPAYSELATRIGGMPDDLLSYVAERVAGALGWQDEVQRVWVELVLLCVRASRTGQDPPDEAYVDVENLRTALTEDPDRSSEPASESEKGGPSGPQPVESGLTPTDQNGSPAGAASLSPGEQVERPSKDGPAAEEHQPAGQL